MACSKCGRKSWSPPQPVATYVPPANPKPMPKIASIPLSSKDSNKICEKCGWMYKRIRYIDVKSHTIVEKFCCPNRNCANFQL